MPWFNVANVGMLTGDLQILAGNGGRNDWIHRTLPASAVKSLRRLTPPPDGPIICGEKPFEICNITGSPFMAAVNHLRL